MKAVTQLIARFTILCYLVVASIAAAHAFPMPSAAGSGSATMVMDASMGDSQAQFGEESASMDGMQPDCHQSKKVSSDASSMSLCKISCSAMGHALTVDILVDLASIAPPIQAAFLSDNLRTRQLVVEQHPPK